jgi:hypothetical protein
MNWRPDRDGWLIRQQQWGEPSELPGEPYAFVSRGRWFARGAAIAVAVDRHCGREPQLTLPLAA